MSLPTIPDINPDIDIKQEDALNLLLDSMASEEKSINKLIEAQRLSVMRVLDDYKRRRNDRQALQDMLAVNESVEANLKNLARLQMLLHYKMNDVRELMPNRTHTSSCSYCGTRSHSYTSTRTCSVTHSQTATCTAPPVAKAFPKPVSGPKQCPRRTCQGNNMPLAMFATALALIFIFRHVRN